MSFEMGRRKLLKYYLQNVLLIHEGEHISNTAFGQLIYEQYNPRHSLHNCFCQCIL